MQIIVCNRCRESLGKSVYKKIRITNNTDGTYDPVVTLDYCEKCFAEFENFNSELLSDNDN